MERLGLDIYDELPKSMMAYLRNYGFHFNKDAFDYAVSFMKKNGIPKQKRMIINLKEMMFIQEVVIISMK